MGRYSFLKYLFESLNPHLFIGKRVIEMYEYLYGNNKIIDEDHSISKQQKDDMINHPSHYTSAGEIYETIKVIEAWQLDFHLGNVVKYISRYDKKGDPIENLEKAKWYLERKIKQLKEK